MIVSRGDQKPLRKHKKEEGENRKGLTNQNAQISRSDKHRSETEKEAIF